MEEEKEKKLLNILYHSCPNTLYTEQTIQIRNGTKLPKKTATKTPRNGHKNVRKWTKKIIIIKISMHLILIDVGTFINLD